MRSRLDTDSDHEHATSFPKIQMIFRTESNFVLQSFISTRGLAVFCALLPRVTENTVSNLSDDGWILLAGSEHFC